MAHKRDGATGHIHEQLQLKIGARGVGNDSLQRINFLNQKLIDKFLNLRAIIFIRIPFQRVEKPLIDHDSELISVLKFLDFFNKQHERIIGLDDKVIALIVELVVGVGLAGEETCSKGEFNGQAEVEEGFGEEGVGSS